MSWIKDLIIKNCNNCHTFIDIFAWTWVVTSEMLDCYNEYIINDFLYSNNVIYKWFFLNKKFSEKKLEEIKLQYSNLNPEELEDNYVSENYWWKYFSANDAKKIWYIREDIEVKYKNKEVNEKEYYILLASLLYSFDKSANTVGHYEAFIRKGKITDQFNFDLIEPYKWKKEIKIYREDANSLVRKIEWDIAFIDPPYNSRQYSRFYHVMETIIKRDKPELIGVAMKPKEENMSDYCRNKAPEVFSDLINNLKVKYIAVTYNNTYNSKSSSSKNKITLEEIKDILEKRWETTIYEHKYNAFNAGKTELDDHKEYLFLTKVTNG